MVLVICLDQNDRNTVDNSVPSASSTMRSNGKARTPSVPDLTRTTSPPAMVTPISTLQNEIPVQEDIRLCTIIRADPEDSVGIELSYHRLQHFHSLTVIPGRDNGPSSRIHAFIVLFLTLDLYCSFDLRCFSCRCSNWRSLN